MADIDIKIPKEMRTMLDEIKAARKAAFEPCKKKDIGMAAIKCLHEKIVTEGAGNGSQRTA